MARNAPRRFERVFMGTEYQLMHQASSDPSRVAPGSSFYQCADLETLPDVPQVIGDLGVPHAVPVVAPVLVCYFGLSLSTRERKASSLFESMLISEWLFNIAKTYLHEAVFAQRTWLLSLATASAAEKHCPRSQCTSWRLATSKRFQNVCCRVTVWWHCCGESLTYRSSEEYQGFRSTRN